MKTLIAVSISGIAQPKYLTHLIEEDSKNTVIISHGFKSLANADDTRGTILQKTINRNTLRAMAFQSDAEWFLFLDDGVYLPKGAIAEFIKAGKEIMGGWYQMEGATAWSALKEEKDGRFTFFTKPEKGIVEVGAVGLGCVMIHRPTLQKFDFNPGLENVALIDGITVKGGPFPHMGDSLALSFNAKKIEEKVYMIGDVVCVPEVSKIEKEKKK